MKQYRVVLRKELTVGGKSGSGNGGILLSRVLSRFFFAPEILKFVVRKIHDKIWITKIFQVEHFNYLY